MRLRSISIAWFRGAAESVNLDFNGKSAVIYGANGAGKSSFVDAIEYAIAGRIDHLAHEYSGKRQERATVNTHAPASRTSNIQITFEDRTDETVTIDRNGLANRKSSATAGITTWSLKRTVLRQDEVAAFISDTKGAKYSALLPLLGLGSIEIAADNIRQLARVIETTSRRGELRTKLDAVERQRQLHFSGKSVDQIRADIVALHAKYELGTVDGKAEAVLCDEVLGEIDRRFQASTADQQRFVALSDIANNGIGKDIAAVRVASAKLAGHVEPLLREKLEVLRNTSLFARGLSDKGDVNCPACGRAIESGALKEHVKLEQLRLQDLITTSDSLRASINSLVGSVRMMRSRLSTEETKSWVVAHANGSYADGLKYLSGLNVNQIADHCDEAMLSALESHLGPLIAGIQEECKTAPASAAQLSADRQVSIAGKTVLTSIETQVELDRAYALVGFVESLESAIREEIRRKAENVIKAISADIQSMWNVLHPGSRVENVHLYVSPGADKGIDIGLKFHGVDLNSPRLTLSEGYRNSLGLCIFLAMANRETETDRPLILDDVVVSLDRQHRGMIVELLSTHFASRQVVVLTHDRDWYSELRPQLIKGDWLFRVLLPYEAPNVGIRWSKTTSTFEDARAHLKDRPDSAGNDARKIMDVELATVSQEVNLRLPYLRAERNDQRMCQEFLLRLIADGRKCLQKMENDVYVVDTARLTRLESAQTLLAAWANRASHTHDLVRPEAEKLIDACEDALKAFGCPSCGKDLWHAEAKGEESVQCRCGAIRWRYGKG